MCSQKLSPRFLHFFLTTITTTHCETYRLIKSPKHSQLYHFSEWTNSTNEPSRSLFTIRCPLLLLLANLITLWIQKPHSNELLHNSAYLLFVCSQIAVHFLRLEKGRADAHGEANVQHPVLPVRQAEDVHVLQRNGKHLRKEVAQQVKAAALPPAKFNKLLGCDVWKIYGVRSQKVCPQFHS